MMAALPVAAQTATPVPTATYRAPGTSGRGSRDCGNGLPCGPIPWNLPSYPVLESPTPMPTFVASATPTVTFTPSPTLTPTNFTPSPTFTPTSTASATFTPTITATFTATFTLTPLFDTGPLDDALATAGAALDATPITVEIDGTPVTVLDQIATAAPGVADLFGRVKGIFGSDWGPFTPPVQALVVSIGVTFVVILLANASTIAGFVVGIVRKIYTAITDLLPF